MDKPNPAHMGGIEGYFFKTVEFLEGGHVKEKGVIGGNDAYNYLNA